MCYYKQQHEHNISTTIVFFCYKPQIRVSNWVIPALAMHLYWGIIAYTLIIIPLCHKKALQNQTLDKVCDEEESEPNVFYSIIFFLQIQI